MERCPCSGCREHEVCTGEGIVCAAYMLWFMEVNDGEEEEPNATD